MKLKLLLLVLCLPLFAIDMAYAQERTVTGKVTSAEEGTPIPGVNVTVKGTANGTATDLDGKFAIQVSGSDAILIFSFIGLKTQEIVVGDRSTIDIRLTLDAVELGEVVVTALGMPKEKRALGYAVTNVSGEKIAQNPETDVARILRGKAPGVNITQTSGVSGSATNIVIRGYTSVTSSNQPLFIVDGVPFDGGTNYQNNFVNGQNESSRFLDLDPNNIESINILKGLNATVLYGDRGRNGVIVITTKNGKKIKANAKNEVTFSTSYFVNEIASLPDRTKTHGTGFQRAYGPFFSNWGPDFSEVKTVPHPYDRPVYAQAFPQFAGKQYAYKYYDSEGFWRRGSTKTVSLNVSGGSEKVSYNASYGRIDETGFTPGNGMVKNNFSFGGNAELSNRFTINSSFNVAQTDRTSPPIAASLGSGVVGNSASVFGDVFYTPTSIDLMGLPYENPLDGSSAYYRGSNDIQNPRWTVAHAKFTELTTRFFGNVSASFKFSDGISLMYRVGLDTYSQEKTNGQDRGGVDGNINGSYTTTTGRNQIWNHDVILNLNGKINSDIGYSGVIGYQARHDLYEESSIFSSNQVVFGVLNHFNFTTYSASQYKEAQNRLGAYASATFDYKNYLFLNLTGRNDWSNTIEKQNQSIFYPGASLSFVATDAFSFLNDSPLISFLKFRVGYGSSANFPGPYSTRSTLSLDSRRFVERTGEVVVTNAVSSRLGNPNLKPSRVNEIEVGVETKLWNNRIGLDLSLFKKSTKDLIIDQNLDPSTGYTVKRTNAGVLEVKGIELGYNASILKAGNFSWDISGNFVAQRSMTVSLPNGTDRIAIAGFTNLGNFAVPNKPYGVIMGSYIERNSEGQPIVNAEGEYVVSNNIKIIGNPNPDWTSAITNTFAYKNFRLSFEFQYTHGGDIYSRTAANLVGRGITTATDDVGRKTFVLPGVVKNADGSYSPNTTQITGTDMYFNVLGFGADELKVWDATTIRLNEVSLAYTLPKELISKTPFGSVSLTASGSNLWYKAINFPDAINFDPNVVGTGVGNGQGLDFLSGPSVRRYGISLRATF